MASSNCLMGDETSSEARTSWSGICDKMIIIPDLHTPTIDIPEKTRTILTCITNVQAQITIFSNVFEKVGSRIVLSVSEKECYRKKTFQHADQDGYKGEMIAETFHEVAGSEGLLALIVFSRHSRKLLRQWKNILEDCRPWVINKAVELLKRTCVLEFPQDSHDEYRKLPISEVIDPPSSMLDKLDSSHIEFAALLVFLGGQCITTDMLVRLTRPLQHIDHTGSVVLKGQPDLGGILKSANSLDAGLGVLQKLGLIRTQDCGKTWLIPQDVRNQVTAISSQNHAIHRVLTAIIHAFPVDPDIVVSLNEDFATFGQIGRSQLPHVFHLASCLKVSRVIDELSARQLHLLLRSCIAWTEFGDCQWKQTVLEIMEKVSDALRLAECQWIIAKKRLREKELARLYRGQIQLTQEISFDNLLLECTHLGYNSGSIVLLYVQTLIDHDRLGEALGRLQELETQLKPRSCFETTRLQQRILYLRLYIYYVAGDFQSAHAVVNLVLGSKGQISRRVSPRLTRVSIATQCELNQIAMAKTLIPDVNLTEWQWIGKEVRGMSLAGAGIHISQGLLLLQTLQSDDAWRSLSEAKSICTALSASYSTSTLDLLSTLRYLNVLLYLSIITHIEGHFKNRHGWGAIYLLWSAPWHLLGDLEKRFDQQMPFIKSLIMSARSHALMQQQNSEEATALFSEAKLLYQRTGRSFHFVAVGTKCFDLFGDLTEECGLGRLSDLHTEDYCKAQKDSGYPATTSSSRLCI